MKKLLLLIVVLGVAWVGLQSMRAGRFALMPPAATEEDRRIREIEEELASIKSQISQAGRSAGMTGMDTSGDVSALMERQKELEKELAEAREKKR